MNELSTREMVNTNLILIRLSNTMDHETIALPIYEWMNEKTNYLSTWIVNDWKFDVRTVTVFLEL